MIKKIILIMAFISFLFGEPIIAAEEKRLPLATGEWFPYTGKRLEGGGFFTELITVIVKEMRMQPEYRFYPWPRTTLLTEEGKNFGAFPYAFTEERGKKFYFSDPIYLGGIVFFYSKIHLKEKPIYKNLDDFKTYKIGTIRGSHPYSTLSEAGFKEIHQVGTVKQLFLLLNTGRISFIMINKLVGISEVNRTFPAEKKQFGFIDIFPKTSSYLMISKSYPNSDILREQFNHALKQVKKTGAFDRVLVKYGLK